MHSACKQTCKLQVFPKFFIFSCIILPLPLSSSLKFPGYLSFSQYSPHLPSFPEGNSKILSVPWCPYLSLAVILGIWHQRKKTKNNLCPFQFQLDTLLFWLLLDFLIFHRSFLLATISIDHWPLAPLLLWKFIHLFPFSFIFLFYGFFLFPSFFSFLIVKVRKRNISDPLLPLPLPRWGGGSSWHQWLYQSGKCPPLSSFIYGFSQKWRIKKRRCICLVLSPLPNHRHLGPSAKLWANNWPLPQQHPVLVPFPEALGKHFWQNFEAIDCRCCCGGREMDWGKKGWWGARGWVIEDEEMKWNTETLESGPVRPLNNINNN